jgi:hypothetical protein
VAHYMNTHVNQDWASVYLVGLGLALLTVFLVQLRTVLRISGRNLLPNVAFAAGIFFVMGFAILGMFQVVLILAAHNHQYSIVQTINFTSDNNQLVIVFGLALLTLSTGLAILVDRAASLPRTLGWYSLLVGVVACLGPLGGLAFLFGLPIWVIATGFVISTKARRGTLSPPTTDGGGTAATAVPVTSATAAA